MKYPSLSTGHLAAASLHCFQHRTNSYTLLEEKQKKYLGRKNTTCEVLVAGLLCSIPGAPAGTQPIGHGLPSSNEELRSIQPVLWASEDVAICGRTSALQMQARSFFMGLFSEALTPTSTT